MDGSHASRTTRKRSVNGSKKRKTSSDDSAGKAAATSATTARKVTRSYSRGPATAGTSEYHGRLILKRDLSDRGRREGPHSVNLLGTESFGGKVPAKRPGTHRVCRQQFGGSLGLEA